MEVIGFVFGLAGLAFALMAFNQVNELKSGTATWQLGGGRSRKRVMLPVRSRELGIGEGKR